LLYQYKSPNTDAELAGCQRQLEEARPRVQREQLVAGVAGSMMSEDAQERAGLGGGGRFAGAGEPLVAGVAGVAGARLGAGEAENDENGENSDVLCELVLDMDFGETLGAEEGSKHAAEERLKRAITLDLARAACGNADEITVLTLSACF
jgi:hypothetical protein